MIISLSKIMIIIVLDPIKKRINLILHYYHRIIMENIAKSIIIYNVIKHNPILMKIIQNVWKQNGGKIKIQREIQNGIG